MFTIDQLYTELPSTFDLNLMAHCLLFRRHCCQCNIKNHPNASQQIVQNSNYFSSAHIQADEIVSQIGSFINK